MATKAFRGSFSVTVYQGDFKTLLAFDLAKGDAVNLAGFTIQAAPQDGKTHPYYLVNFLRFAPVSPGSLKPPYMSTSSLNAPFQKFRWLHVPGQFHQGTSPSMLVRSKGVGARRSTGSLVRSWFRRGPKFTLANVSKWLY
ncbi:MAG: hypothetical protein WB810_10905 [Candidatus Cybelea sp.]